MKENGMPLDNIGIRIDSGDLAYLSKEARKILDKAGYKDTTICLSNGLDEYTIKDLIEQGACFNSLGVGDNIAASKERIGGVYKLVAKEEQNKISPRMKISDNPIKTTTPGFKKVIRFYDKKTGFAKGDCVALRDETIDEEIYTLTHSTDTWKKTTLTNYIIRELQIPIFIKGEKVYKSPSIQEQQLYCQKEYESIYPEVTRLLNPHEYYVDLSDNLRELKGNLILEARREQEEEIL